MKFNLKERSMNPGKMTLTLNETIAITEKPEIVHQDNRKTL